ncbi:flagellar hook-associated protein 1 FlgK [Alkalithermobacter thermoalcaliphilus JW-YL-7 = DSM 7308]|uniref:Flagellar hook-associated protein 1 n=1 Tax=Alkalithermobacter thermoalcaliphilus JW-YL-7 = DSM 7308 TaxID=1121328 RepID=A0A150FN47_CLOPD|nr:flagellar hook-associated protein FlgK [[Clostridium] paradoxum JW-YL-7 = DSM 7308]SHL05833.1 flagellar hook-associated protein 1 FlgK [[Clostridium] paradoxum JW-YL-7 = DSM 7308]
MRSTFFGFNIARTGLFTAQRALDVVGHNIANAQTPGYSRQRVEQTQLSPLAIPGGRGMLGAGVEAIRITQIRNEFLDVKFRNENTSFGEWQTRYETLSEIEAIINEPSNSGIRNVMDEFFSSIQELSKDPSSLTVRALVRQRAIAFCNTINHMYRQFEKMARDMDFAIKTTVSQINNYAKDIAKLNDAIYRAELDGSSANDLRDQRNLLIDNLSKLVKVEITEIKDPNLSNSGSGKMSILINGQALVSHDKVDLLNLENRTEHPHIDGVMIGNLRWDSGSTIDISGLNGQLRAQFDMRDNADGNFKGIPYYINKLNEFTKEFAKEFNKVHSEGYGLSDTGTGNNFFDIGSVAARDIKISQLIEMDLDYIAAAKNAYEDGRGIPGDGSNALLLSKIRDNHNMFDWGSPDDFLKSLVSNLGVDAQEARRMSENQEILIQQVDYQRQSISGVSLDEEMANMIKFQHSYNAAARMITAMDEMIDVLINRLGRVGL